MWILASFTDSGVPASGISPLPTIRIRNVDTTAIVVTDAFMTETGDGFYAYDFAAQDVAEDYSFRCDAGNSLSTSDRYTFGSSGPYDESIDTIASTVSDIDVRTTLTRKIQTNRLELIDGSISNWVLYDDDSVSTLLTFSVTDKNGQAIIQPSNTPSKRTKAV